ncbi:MAG: hypothetical protein MK076_03270 [Flavobacteriales bacterium]|nr:hypothetical protein [Flavobacteriales bacterium]
MKDKTKIQIKLILEGANVIHSEKINFPESKAASIIGGIRSNFCRGQDPSSGYVFWIRKENGEVLYFGSNLLKNAILQIIEL